MADSGPQRNRRRSGTSFQSDLGLELYRQHTLLSVMAARMRESSDALTRVGRIDRQRIRRALDVHRTYLIEGHLENERRVDEALAEVKEAGVRRMLAECASEPATAAAFQEEAGKLVAEGTSSSASRAAELAGLFRREAARLEEHHAREEQQVYAYLGRLLAAETTGKLLREIREFDERRVNAEIALISWASELHPSSD